MSSIADRLKRLAQQKSQAAKVDIRALLLSKKAAPSSDDIRSKLLKLGNRPTETVAVPELAPGEIKTAPSFFDQIGNVKEKKGRAKAQVLDVAIGKEEDEDPPWAKKRAQRSPVSRSDEWHRIYTLPRRPVDFSRPPEMRHLYKPGATFKLNAIQAWALAEIEKNQGLAGPLAVGAGKSVISLLAPTVLNAERALLFVPPQLKEKVLSKDIPKFYQHFRIELHRFKVVAYSQLSVASGSDLLSKLKPDVLIFDEAHCVKDPKSARTKRVRRYLKEFPNTKVVILTGTATRNSIRDIAMLYEWALKEKSPVPRIRAFHELMDWAEALDVSDDPLEPGALVEFCNEEERRIIAAAHPNDLDSLRASHNAVRSGFRRRVVSTPGVVATEEGSIATSLQIAALRPNIPVAVCDALIKLRTSWEIEGYEAFEDAMRVAVAARQIASGFFLRWAWEKLPGNAEGKKDMDWLLARREWHREVREILKRSREGLDSPMLVAKAAAEGKIKTHAWAAWAEQKHKPIPPTEAVWISDFLLEEAAAWGEKTCSKKEGGIIWAVNPCVGERLSDLTGWPYFGAGDKASKEIINMTPDKAPVIIASLDAHGTGKDLQTYSRNLYTSPPSSATKWEQSLARTHRFGQLADLVCADVFMHTAENEAAFKSAIQEAEFVEATTGQKQKLLYADKVDLE